MEKLLKYKHTQEKFNTNNAWGFGGGYGTRYHFNNGFVVSVGIACYRHLPSHKFFTVKENDKTILDKTRLSDADIEQIIKLITK